MSLYRTGDSFASRLRQVIGDRKIAPWARQLGIPAGTRSRMLKDGGIPPTYDLLTRLMEVENVNISWLLGAADAPYRVCRTSSEEGTSEAVARSLREEAGSQAHLLIGGERRAWLLVRLAEIDHPQGAISHWAIEVIAGPVSDAAINFPIRGVHTLSAKTMDALYEGRLGTWQLLGQADDPAAGLVNVCIDQEVSQAAALGEPAQRAGEGTPAALKALGKWWPLMTEVEQAALMVLLDPLLENARLRHLAVESKPLLELGGRIGPEPVSEGGAELLRRYARNLSAGPTG